MPANTISGFVAGDPKLIAHYSHLRSYGGCQVPLPVQAAAAALWRDKAHVEENRAKYRRKFDIAEAALAGGHTVVGTVRKDSDKASFEKLGAHGVALEPGHIVLAGSFTRVVFARKGDTLHGDFGALGGIAVQFV